MFYINISIGMDCIVKNVEISTYNFFYFIDFKLTVHYDLRFILYSICVPRVQVKRRPSATGLLLAPTQLALCLRLAYIDF